MKLFDEWNEEKGWVEFVSVVGYGPAAPLPRLNFIQLISPINLISSSLLPTQANQQLAEKKDKPTLQSLLLFN